MDYNSENIFYVYIFLDSRKPGIYSYNYYDTQLTFEYESLYIGKGKNDRLNVHVSQAKHKNHPNKLFENKINAILNDDKTPIINKLFENLDFKTSLEIEEKLILNIGRIYDKSGPLCNITIGGSGVIGYNHTEETKERIRLNCKGINRGEKSKETKEKISKTKIEAYKNGTVVHALLGTKWSDETREKNKISRTGLKWTDEQKEKLKIIRCLNKPSNTDDWKIIDPDNNEYIAHGLGEFCRNHNLSQSHMYSVFKGIRKHHKGWKCHKLPRE